MTTGAPTRSMPGDSRSSRREARLASSRRFPASAKRGRSSEAPTRISRTSRSSMARSVASSGPPLDSGKARALLAWTRVKVSNSSSKGSGTRSLAWKLAASNPPSEWGSREVLRPAPRESPAIPPTPALAWPITSPIMETPAPRAHPGPQLVVRLDAARHDLDDAGQRIGAVDRRQRPAHDLDPVEVDQREGRWIEGSAPGVGRIVDAHAVDEDDDVVRIESSQRELRPAPRSALLHEMQSRDEAQRIRDRSTDPEIEALAGQHTRLEGRVADPVAHPRPRHDPFVRDPPLVL